MAGIMHIWFQLQTLKKEALSITDFVVKMKEIVQSLTTASQIISELDQISYILGGLGQEFDPVIASITAKKGEITLQEAQFLLMSFKARLEKFTTHITIDLPPASTNVLHRIHKGELPPNFISENNQNFRGKFRGRGRSRIGRFSNSRPTCQLCGKSGHFATVCYYRYDNSTGNFGRQQGQQGPMLQQYPSASMAQQYSSTPMIQQYPLASVAQQYSSGPMIQHYPSAPTYQLQSSDINALVATASTVQDPHWYVDSGATNHITSDINNLSLNSSAYRDSESLAIGSGQTLPISHIGKSYFHSLVSSYPKIILNNVLFVPRITKNLLSISRFIKDNNITVEFTGHCCFVKDKPSRQVLLQGILKDGLYQLILPHSSASLEVKSSTYPSFNSSFSYLSSTISSHMFQYKSNSMSSDVLVKP
ncbi:hypothetical protein ACOSP7_017364 [Xanthoceras sorbifolium]